MGIWLAVAGAICCITGFCFKKSGVWKALVLRFFDGLLLAFLCFVLFPVVFEEGDFLAGVVGILIGILLGAALEYKTTCFFEDCTGKDFLHSGAFFISVLLGYVTLPELQIGRLIYSFLVALCGGIFLLIVCGGILPECSSKKWQVVSATGGFIGFLVGVFILF